MDYSQLAFPFYIWLTCFSLFFYNHLIRCLANHTSVQVQDFYLLGTLFGSIHSSGLQLTPCHRVSPNSNLLICLEKLAIWQSAVRKRAKIKCTLNLFLLFSSCMFSRIPYSEVRVRRFLLKGNGAEISFLNSALTRSSCAAQISCWLSQWRHKQRSSRASDPFLRRNNVCHST